MANGYFVVQNGIQIGGLTIHAANADISTSGNISTSGSGGLAANKIYSGTSNVSVTADNIFANIAGTNVLSISSTGVGVSGTVTVGESSVGASTISTGTLTAGTVNPTYLNVGNDVTVGGATSLSTATAGGLQAKAIGNVTPGTGAFTTLSASGVTSITNSTASSSTTTGALVVTGGVGVGGDMRIAGNIYAASLNTVTSSQLNVTAPMVYLEANAYPYTFDIGLYSHFVGGPANVYTHTGVVRSYQNGYYGFFSNVKAEPAGTVNWTDAGLIWDTVKAGALTLANTTAATSTTSGALTVAGGAGIAGAVYIGGNGTNSIVHTGHILPSSNVTYNLGSSTAWYGTYYGVATQAKYADLAENYQADNDYTPGQVLMFGGDAEVTIAETNTRAVAGIVSTNPAHLMNGQLRGNRVVPLALQGRVPCNVIGPVRKGDLMISAGFGFAKSHNMPEVGQVIGKALQNFNGEKGVIEVVVGRV